MRPKADETTQGIRSGVIDRSGSSTNPLSTLTRTAHQRWLMAALALTGSITIASASIAVLAPGVRRVLLGEDGIIETASAICLAIAILGTGAISAIRGPRWPVLLAGLIALAELTDETSFGARVFGFEPPPLYGGGELDGFHDLLILAYRLLHDLSPVLAWLWLALIFVASAAVVLIALRQPANVVRGGGSWLADHVLLFLHVGFIGLSQVIDVATSSRALSAVEEVLEFNAALLLVLYVFQQTFAPAALPNGRASARVRSASRP